MNNDFNFSNLNDEAKVNRSHIAQSPNGPNTSNLSNVFNKSQINPQIKKIDIIFPKQTSNGLLQEERKTFNLKNSDNLPKNTILQSKSAIYPSANLPQFNNKSLNSSQISNNLTNLGIVVNVKDKLNQNHNSISKNIVFPPDIDNNQNKSIYSLQSKDLDNSRINQNNITNSIHDPANGINFLDNSNIQPNLKIYQNKNQTDFPTSFPNKDVSEILNFSNNLVDQSKVNQSKIKVEIIDKRLSNPPLSEKIDNNENPYNSYINTEQEINENDIIMMEENIHEKETGNSLMEEVRVGAYGGKVNHPTLQSKLNETESVYEDAKSELNTQSNNPIGVYGNMINRNNTSFNNSHIFNDESKRNISTEKNPGNNQYFTLKNQNINQKNLYEDINLPMPGNLDRRDSTLNNPATKICELQNKSINDLKNLDKSRTSQNPITPILKYKEEILGKSVIDLGSNQNQSEFIFNDRKYFDEELSKNQEIRNNSFFSPNPNQKENFQRIFEQENSNINEFKNFNLNDENPKSRALSISNIEKNNFQNIQVVPTPNNEDNSNIPVKYDTNYKNLQDQFFSDPDEENNKNHNFKLLLETEHSKSKLETRIRNDTNVNNYLDIRPDNSQLNFSGISNNIIENQNRDADLKIPNSNQASNSVINKSVNYGNKIKTIFDEPNDENPGLSNKNLCKISIPNYLNKTANINPNNLNQILNDRRNLSMNNPSNFNINKANVVNYYNFNFNNDFKVNHDTQIKDFDLTLETKSIVNPTHQQETNTILKTEALETDKLIPEEEEKNIKSLIYQDYEPEILVRAKAECIDIHTDDKEEKIKDNLDHEVSVSYKDQPKEDIHFIIRNSVEKLNESIFENSILEINKTECKQLKPLTNVKPNSESLTNLYGQDFLNDWNETAVIKIANNKKGVREDKYFIQGFLNEYNLIDAVKIIDRDYIQSLDELNPLIRMIYRDPETNNILELEDILQLDNIGMNLKYNNNQNTKKEVYDYLQKKATKNTFNKISYLYDNEILNQKYNISNEKILLDINNETNVFTNFNNRNIEGEVTSQLNNMNIINNELTIKKNLSVINEVDSFNETRKVKNIFNITHHNNDGKIHLWRESICDGNSFYRIFMFGYLEYLIFEKDFALLAKLFLRILLDYFNKEEINNSLLIKDQLNLTRIFQNIDIERILIIMNIIINQMRINDYLGAYKSMINAFNDDDSSFDRIMIEYLRVNLYHQILQIEQLDLNDKLKETNSIINFDLTNIKNNAYLFVEAGKIHLDAVTKVYKVDVELYYFDRALSNLETKFSSSKKVFKFREEYPDTPKICMFYNLSHFSLFYTSKNFIKQKQILRSPMTNLNNIIIFENNFKCDECFIKNNKKVFFKMQNISCCYECIKVKTDKIVEGRAVALIGDNYMSREFCCRPLKVDDNLLINDYIYIQLFSKNIWSSIRDNIRSICDKCSKKSKKCINTDGFYNICVSCVKILIDFYVNYLVIKEDFKKAKYIRDNLITDIQDLKANLDINQAISHLGIKIEDLKTQERARLRHLYESTCCVCAKNKKNKNPVVEFFNISINKESNIDNCNTISHIICNSCVNYMNKTIKSGSVSKDILNILETTSLPLRLELDCKLCGIDHSTLIYPNIRLPSKSTNKDCCGGCNIF